MNSCAHCGKDNSAESSYCEDCGKAIDRPSAEAVAPNTVAEAPAKNPVGRQSAVKGVVRCPSCAKDVVRGLPFCPSCGKRLTAKQEGVRSCANCGIPLGADAKFCATCGRNTDGSPQGPRTSAFAAQRSDVPGELAVVDESGEISSTHDLTGAETTIGRDGADIEFRDDAFMSPLHAQVNITDGQFSVRDLGSRNGTWIFIAEPHRLSDGDLVLIGSQILLFRRLGYPGPHPPERDATRRMGSLVPSADIARLVQLRSDGSQRDTFHLSPGRNMGIGRERGDWIFGYDPSLSALHAEVRSEDADFVVVDAGSRNGVAVSVRGEVTLKNGSRFLVGDKLFRLVLP